MNKTCVIIVNTCNKLTFYDTMHMRDVIYKNDVKLAIYSTYVYMCLPPETNIHKLTWNTHREILWYMRSEL